MMAGARSCSWIRMTAAVYHKTLGIQAVGAARHPGSHDVVGYRDNPVQALNF